VREDDDMNPPRLRADFLGSAGRHVLVRCACGRKLYLDRQTWEKYSFMSCDNCRACIEYNSLRLIPFGSRGTCMDSFIETKERKEIVDELTQATNHLARAAELMGKAGYPKRADKTKDTAQMAISLRSLIARDWKDEDSQAA
jgi:hypothetical protein